MPRILPPDVHLLPHASWFLLPISNSFQFPFSTDSFTKETYCQNAPKLLFNAAEIFFLLIFMFSNAFVPVNSVTVIPKIQGV